MRFLKRCWVGSSDGSLVSHVWLLSDSRRSEHSDEDCAVLYRLVERHFRLRKVRSRWKYPVAVSCTAKSKYKPVHFANFLASFARWIVWSPFKFIQAPRRPELGDRNSRITAVNRAESRGVGEREELAHEDVRHSTVPHAGQTARRVILQWETRPYLLWVDEGSNIHDSRGVSHKLQTTDSNFWRAVGNQANLSPPFPKPERWKLPAPIDYTLRHDYFRRLNLRWNTEKTLFTCACSHAKRSSAKRSDECR